MKNKLLFLLFLSVFFLFASENVTSGQQEIEAFLRQDYTSLQVENNREMHDVLEDSGQGRIDRGWSDYSLAEKCCKGTRNCGTNCCKCCDCFCGVLPVAVPVCAMMAVFGFLIYNQEKHSD